MGEVGFHHWDNKGNCWILGELATFVFLLSLAVLMTTLQNLVESYHLLARVLSCHACRQYHVLFHSSGPACPQLPKRWHCVRRGQSFG